MNIRIGSTHEHPAPRADCRCCAPNVQSILKRVDVAFSRHGFLAGAAAASVAIIGAPARAADAGTATMFTNVNVFTGKSLVVLHGMSVLVKDGMLADMQPGKMQPPDGAATIDGGGRTLMPGLIDNHVHIFLSQYGRAARRSESVSGGYVRSGRRYASWPFPLRSGVQQKVGAKGELDFIFFRPVEGVVGTLRPTKRRCSAPGIIRLPDLAGGEAPSSTRRATSRSAVFHSGLSFNVLLENRERCAAATDDTVRSAPENRLPIDTANLHCELLANQS
jgi:hypothetical protein